MTLAKALICSTALFRFESWTLRKTQEKIIEVFEAWLWRREQGVSWKEGRANDWVRREVDVISEHGVC